ncbi:MAG: tetratricopeptide repeat protein [Deltaproteobacteria bacterium]|nr:tetratricopeptide repeat protein [Deltaproteobacteria bacterium]
MMQMNAPSRWFTFAFLAAALSVQLACSTTSGGKKIEVTAEPDPNQKVVLDGEEMTLDHAAEKKYREGVRKRDAEDLPGALAAFEETQKNFAGNRWGDLALLGAAQVHLDEERPKDAEKILEQFLLERPTSEVLNDVRVMLALAQLAQGDAKSAQPVLEKIIDQAATPEAKYAAGVKLAEELRASGNVLEAVQAYLKAYENGNDDEKKSIESLLLAIVDREMSFTDIRLLKEGLSKKGFVDEVATWKMIRVHVHLRDYIGALEGVETYLRDYSDGRFAKEAQETKDRLLARTAFDLHTFGVVLPLSGPYRVPGQRALTSILLGMGIEADVDVLKGWAEAAKKAQKDPKATFDAAKPVMIVKGTKKGQPAIKVVVMDSLGDVEHTRLLMRTLVEEHHVAAVVGDILLSTSHEVALQAEEYQVPVVSLSRKKGLPQLGPWVFRINFTAEKQARALATLAIDKLGHKRFGLLYPRLDYGVEMMNFFWDEVDAHQGEITAVEAYAHDETTFTMKARSLVGRADLASRFEFNVCKNKAKEVKDSYRRRKAMGACDGEAHAIVDFDALLIPHVPKTISYIVPALEAEDMLLTTDARITAAFKKTVKGGRVKRVRLLGGSYWNNPDLARRLGRQIDGAMIVDGFNPRSGERKVQHFVTTFKKFYRDLPGLRDAQSHDAGLLLLAIVRGEGTKAPTSRAELRAALAEAKGFPGVTGLVGFDKDGDSNTPPFVFTFERGELELVEDKGES